MIRDEIIRRVRLDLIGPDNILDKGSHDEEEISENPIIKYLSGILEPISDASDTDNDDEKSLEDAVSAISQSSMGLSFRRKPNASLKIRIDFGIYEKKEDKYKRIPKTKVLDILDTDIEQGHNSYKIFEDASRKLDLLLIDHAGEPNGLTIATLINSKSNKTGSRPKFDECFFQVGLSITSEEGILPFQSDTIDLSRDELLNRILYHEVKRYGSGHGCSIEWEEEEGGCHTLSSSFLPSYTIDKLVHNRIKKESSYIGFSMKQLSEAEKADEWIPILKAIPEAYLEWLEDQRIPELEKAAVDEVKRNGHLVEKVAVRIRRGIETIEKDKNVLKAFTLMNEAMLLQQLRYKQPTKDYQAGLEYIPVEIGDESTWPSSDGFVFGEWRLFQIAFILMNLNSLVAKTEEDKAERDIFDLIWFPTGGGKTEAYLGLTAFTLFHELLDQKATQGVSVLMRYTLRLLSTQQFERASALIVACNDIKRGYGIPGEPLSIGLWVGSKTTPNNENQAFRALADLIDGEENRFSITRCPRCSTAFGHFGSKIINGFKEGANGVEVHCNVCCDSGETLPLYVVDTDIKRVRPKLLITTVDKFALLAWDATNRHLLGVDVPERGDTSPLSLIIQDELHLIDGPLGTIVGLYELALDYVLQQSDFQPKRIGSTATISRAYEQLSNLYGKNDEQVQFFPQPFANANDNFFSRTIKDESSRRYVGIFANSSPSFKTTQYRANSAILQATSLADFHGGDVNAEAYQTLVSYFNTLKDLGHSRSMLADDIPQHLRVIHKNWALQNEERRFINDYSIIELTSRVPAGEQKANMDRLSIPIRQQGYIDVCLATNMISVGVDIPRLSTMLINMQPKSTSEYIQASSRVGRGSIPGLVFVLYAPNRARDRSHFEQFQIFHNTLQSNVEPATVTPFSKPARERALPGVLISILRNSPGSVYMDTPQKKITDDIKDSILAFLLERCKHVDPQETEDMKKQLIGFFERWNLGFDCYSTFRDKANACKRLFVAYGEKYIGSPKPYRVLTSMRNVDSEEEISYLRP